MANSSHESGRIRSLNAKREEEKKHQERQRELIRKDNQVNLGSIDEQFLARTDTVDDVLVRNTVGLVTKEEYVNKKKMIQRMQDESQADAENAAHAQKKRKKAKKKKQSVNKLSFGDDVVDDIQEEAEDDTPKVRLGKNPTVDTSYLPDAERAEEERQLKSKLRREWTAEQDRLKALPLNITYSYWDGRGHRKDVSVKQGNTIETFLRAVQRDFPELAGTSTGDLLYIKEDLIIPQNFTFYELIATKARGKSGPLFNFDVHDDVRMVNDSRIEKNESHAGKVVERRWYERNKHIFPASRWEIFDPNENYGDYSIHGGEVNGQSADQRRNGTIGADL